MWYVTAFILGAILGAFLMGIVAGGKGVPLSDHYDIVMAESAKSYREGFNDALMARIEADNVDNSEKVEQT